VTATDSQAGEIYLTVVIPVHNEEESLPPLCETLDATLKGLGFASEVVFVDEPGFVTEGSWSNIFVEREGQLLTPPLALGLLPGVLRAELIDKGRAVESHLRLADLESGFFIGNSLRGLVPARLVDAAASSIG